MQIVSSILYLLKLPLIALAIDGPSDPLLMAQVYQNLTLCWFDVVGNTVKQAKAYLQNVLSVACCLITS